MLDKSLLVRLRKETLAPFADCAEALKNSNNDLVLAKQLLFKKSILKSDKNNLLRDEEVPEGKARALTNSQNNLGCIFVLRAQTDFVTNSHAFVELQEELAEIFTDYISDIEEFKELSNAEALKLVSKKDNLTIQEKIATLSGITKEKIKLSELIFSPREKDNSLVLAYTHHNSKLVALLSLQKKREISAIEVEELKKLVVHYAGSDSIFLKKDELNPEWIAQEEKKLRESLSEKNLPEAQIEQIIRKQIEKKKEECTFSSQTFILDPSIKISAILDKYSLSPCWAKKLSL